MKIKVAEACRVTSAAVSGNKLEGKCDLSATYLKKARIGAANVPTGAWTKCSISTADVTAKKVVAPRQNGRVKASAGMSMSKARHEAARNACGRGSVRKSNH